MEAVLDDSKKPVEDARRMLVRTALGAFGSLAILYCALVATATWRGVAAKVSAWAFGPPLGVAAAATLVGVLLLALAAVWLKDSHTMSAVVQAAYRLLDRQEAEASSRFIAAKDVASVKARARDTSSWALFLPFAAPCPSGMANDARRPGSYSSRRFHYRRHPGGRRRDAVVALELDLPWSRALDKSGEQRMAGHPWCGAGGNGRE